MEVSEIIMINWIALTIDLILLYIAIILFIKFGIDPNKQRRRILLKLDKLPQYESRYDKIVEFEDLLERIDKSEPLALNDPIPKYKKSKIIGFCQMCGAGRTIDAEFCHFCGFKFDMSNLEEVINLYNTWGSQKYD